MADPTWVDTSTVGRIADGDSTLEAELNATGGPLLMVPKVQEELFLGNPFKRGMRERPEDQVKLCKAVIERMSIQVDTSGSESDRREFFEKQFKFKSDSTVVRAIEESDAIVLSEIAASAKARGIGSPKFITTDGRLANNADAKGWGVDIRLPSSSSGTPPLGGGGGSALPPETIIGTFGPTPGRGAANAGAAFLIFRLVDTLANYLNGKYQQAEASRAIDSTISNIRDWMIKNPTDGALVVITFYRVRPNDPSGVVGNSVLIHPGDKFAYVDVFFASTPEKAGGQMSQQRELRLDPGPDSPYKYEWRKTSYWVEPFRKTPWSPPLSSPVGWWRVQVGNRWTWFYEFDVNGGVRWVDPFNNQTGRGTWKINDGRLLLSWAPASKTKEEWDSPLTSTQTGRCVMQAGTFSLNAVFGIQPPPDVVNPPLSDPIGTWRVQVSRWTWVYVFDAHAGVRWTDPFNSMTGKGAWKIANGYLMISWAPPSRTKEAWNLPLHASNATGKCSMEDGNFELKAIKQA